MALILEDPDFALLSVKFLIENVFLRVSTRRNSKIFPAWGFYSCGFYEMFFYECPASVKPPLPLKNYGCTPGMIPVFRSREHFKKFMNI